MQALACRNSVDGVTLDGHSIVTTALLISFPVIGLDQFLRTAAARFPADPPAAVGHWLTDSLIALPLFAASVWAADRIAGRAGLGIADRADLMRRALLIALFAALAMAPVWFVLNQLDNPVLAQPLVFPHAQDSGDVYSVAPAVIIALACVCLIPAAAWAGSVLTRGATVATRTAVLLVAVAAGLAFACLLHQAAVRGYASQVYYTPANAPAPGSTAAPDTAAPNTAAPYAFAYQAAHALQDGLAGQAAGLPVAAAALLWVTPRRAAKTKTQPGKPSPKPGKPSPKEASHG
jgi:hypothetical protein